jgi:hypothetical protein
MTRDQNRMLLPSTAYAESGEGDVLAVVVELVHRRVFGLASGSPLPSAVVVAGGLGFAQGVRRRPASSYENAVRLSPVLGSMMQSRRTSGSWRNFVVTGIGLSANVGDCTDEVGLGWFAFYLALARIHPTMGLANGGDDTKLLHGAQVPPHDSPHRPLGDLGRRFRSQPTPLAVVCRGLVREPPGRARRLPP